MEKKNTSSVEEKLLSPMSGFPVLIVTLAVFVCSIISFVFAVMRLSDSGGTVNALSRMPFADVKTSPALAVTVIVVAVVYWCIIMPILCMGLKSIRPNEASVYTVFGKYYGTIAKSGFFFVNPFCVMVNPTAKPQGTIQAGAVTISSMTGKQSQTNIGYKKVSLKATTLANDKQKINDREGNPIEVGVVVIWRIINATKAVFEVDNYNDYVSIQCDAAIRHVARLYPYDVSEDGDEKSLRGSASEVAEELRKELQARTEIAGIEIQESRIAHLAYAPEIAAAMLQRQQADAVIAARQKIVEGAVGMVEMALNKLSENDIVTLDNERKAAMVSNLLVVLCGNRDAQPIVNSGSIY